MAKHFTATEKNRKGYFEKKNPKIRDYRKVCVDGKRGFVGELHEAHHILPATAFKKSIASIASEEKQLYIANCQHVTPWNINNPNNMIGLPHAKAFILLTDRVEGLSASGGHIKKKGKAKKLTSEDLARRQQLEKVKPYSNCIHQPVSWGHTLYNQSVATNLKTSIWDTLQEAKKEHKVNPETFLSGLQLLEGMFFELLQTRGKQATVHNWERRKNPLATSWYECFTMDPAANPFG